MLQEYKAGLRSHCATDDSNLQLDKNDHSQSLEHVVKIF